MRRLRRPIYRFAARVHEWPTMLEMHNVPHLRWRVVSSGHDAATVGKGEGGWRLHGACDRPAWPQSFTVMLDAATASRQTQGVSTHPSCLVRLGCTQLQVCPTCKQGSKKAPALPDLVHHDQRIGGVWQLAIALQAVQHRLPHRPACVVAMQRLHVRQWSMLPSMHASK